MPPRPRLYLAGPEVFLPDAAVVGAEKARLCMAAGFAGVFPLDGTLSLEGLAQLEQARAISLSNEALIRSCDGLIANLTPFRGVSMDAGTAFEVGFMRALGRPVLGYTNISAGYRERAEAYRSAPPRQSEADRSDVQVEDFGLAENLMIEIAILQSGVEVVRRTVDPGNECQDLTGFVSCLEQARRIFAL